MKKSPLATILLVVFVDLIGFGMIIPILPLYAKSFQAAEWQIGLLLGCYSFMQFLASPILGYISDRIGRKPVLLVIQMEHVTFVSYGQALSHRILHQLAPHQVKEYK
jgi:MFS transporter, DHA1 family, tetracycline resistance protein